jgi:hypothetical protein
VSKFGIMMGRHDGQKGRFGYQVDLERRMHADHPLRCAETVRRANRITCGWSNGYHDGHCTRVFDRQQIWLRNRVRRWLWRQLRLQTCQFGFSTGERPLRQYKL